MKSRTSQQFGNGSTVLFTITPISAGKALQVEVNGAVVPYTWTSATQVTLTTPPANFQVVDFFVIDDADNIGRHEVGELEVGGGLGNATQLLKGILGTVFTPASFGAVAANSSVDVTVTVTGAAVGDTVALGGLGALPSGGVVSAWVSAANTVTIRVANVATTAFGAAYSPTGVRATVLKF